MKKLFTTTLLFASCLFAQAQSPIQVKLWTSENGTVVDEQPALKDWVSEIPEATLTIYPASTPNGQAIIACPGGGYVGIAVEHEGHDMASWFNTQGITYAVLHYRMPKGDYQIPLSDVHQAFRYLRRHAEQWKIRRIGIMGSSAGGHLASTAATHFTESTRPDFQILFYPVVTMGNHTHKGSRNALLGENPDSELIEKYSNELQVTPETPPAFIMHSSDDTVVPVSNSINYYLALLENGVSASMHLYPIGGHGWGYHDNFTYKPQWKNELEKWLKEICP